MKLATSGSAGAIVQKTLSNSECYEIPVRKVARAGKRPDGVKQASGIV
jgi:hypothetical protein